MRITKESIRRAARTFLQAAVSYIVVNIVVIDFSSGKQVIESAVIGLIISALSAGLAAVMNMEAKPNE